jgi:adenylylsulfate kinase
VTGAVVWFTGKPSSGKSTLARAAQRALEDRGARVCLLDGDELRDVLVPKPGYDPAARDAFYATLANLASLLARQGLTVLVAATAHARSHRDRARALAPRFVEVYVAVPEAELHRRDSKGLYAAVREGRLTGVPGADVPYEAPSAPELTATGGRDEHAIAQLLELLGD